MLDRTTNSSSTTGYGTGSSSQIVNKNSHNKTSSNASSTLNKLDNDRSVPESIEEEGKNIKVKPREILNL